ncbi:serine hydrolase domain-containing protein, partial [Escherichia coli]
FAHLMSHSTGLGSGLVAEIRRAEAAKAAAEKTAKAAAEKTAKAAAEKTAKAAAEKTAASSATDGGAADSGAAPCGQHSYYVGESSFATLEEAMLDLARYPLGFDPGTEWDYHVSTNMLAYMIERISGKTLREYVKETILEPLGMEHTDWYYAPDMLEHFVKPYNAVDGKLEPATMMNMFARGTI